MAKTAVSKEIIEKLKGLSHVKEVWLNKDGTAYHLTEPMVTKTVIVPKTKKAKRVSEADENWTKVSVKELQATPDAKPYASMNVEVLTALCTERDIVVPDKAKKAEIIVLLEAWDADPANDLG